MSENKPAQTKGKKDLRLLKNNYSPDINPLLDPETVSMKRKVVQSGLAEKTLVDVDTGEIAATAVIRSIEDKDSDEFVKVFAAGIAATYDLSTTGQRVFQVVLQEYERTPMVRGFADSIYLAWFGEGLSGKSVGMSEKTFNRGLRELLDKKFLAPRSPETYWTNPALFFKGDRVLFIKEYRRKKQSAAEKLESQGQQRLID